MRVELPVTDLGRMSYAAAYAEQLRVHGEVLAARGALVERRDRGGNVAIPVGRLLLVEHAPVITVSRRPGARAHLVATEAMLAKAGVEVQETDRGGDITYHGPGQLVAYPIIDLNLLNLRLHAYLRLLEEAIIETVWGDGEWGIRGVRDEHATGVWVGGDGADGIVASRHHGIVAGDDEARRRAAKIAAIGVRVSRWVSMHGLALNVTTDLSHFDLIVPCGLTGRAVTSMEREMGRIGKPPPSMGEVKARLHGALLHRLRGHATSNGNSEGSESAEGLREE